MVKLINFFGKSACFSTQHLFLAEKKTKPAGRRRAKKSAACRIFRIRHV